MRQNDPGQSSAQTAYFRVLKCYPRGHQTSKLGVGVEGGGQGTWYLDIIPQVTFITKYFFFAAFFS